MKKRILLFVLFVCLSLQITGCTSFGTLNSQNNLIVYTSHSPSFIGEIVDEFEHKYHIPVNIVKAGTGELIDRIRDEKDEPLADILWGGSTSLLVKNKDLWEDYVCSNDSSFYEQYQNSDHLFTRFTVLPCTLIVNQDLLGDIKVEGYKDLLNPKLNGKIAMCDPRKSSTAFESVTNMLYTMGDGNPDNGWDYIEQFLENCNGEILSSSSAVFNKVINGEYAVGVTYEGAGMYIDPESSIKLVYPEEGTIANADGITIVKNAKQKKNAEKFIDFVTTKNIQHYTAEKCFRRSVRTDVQTDNFVDFNSMKKITIDIDYVINNESAILDHFDELQEKVKTNK